MATSGQSEGGDHHRHDHDETSCFTRNKTPTLGRAGREPEVSNAERCHAMRYAAHEDSVASEIGHVLARDVEVVLRRQHVHDVAYAYSANARAEID
eukprot:3822790-Pleurochrysis_carterae.AAC.1